MIARRARTAPAPEQLDTGVPEVLNSGGKPLPAPVRQDMESRFGEDFSDVRVHNDSAARDSAAEVGARAYTSGSHVVIGDGGNDQHTLAHELTHVIQQRQGPVAGTDNGSGLRISDPSDRFEREAEANAHRVMSASPARTVQDAGQETATAPTDGTPAVQRVSAGEEEEAAYERMHRNPAGPALRVRGPYKSKKDGRTNNQVTDPAVWAGFPAEHREAAGRKQRMEIHDDPQTLHETDRPLRDALSNAGRSMEPDWQAMQHPEVLEAMGRRDPQTRGYWAQQDQRDADLTRQSAERVTQYWSSPEEQARRPAPQEVDATVADAPRTADGAPSAANQLRALLDKHEGVILAGEHAQSKVWGFVIDNMQMLRDAGVRTIYLESIKRDDAYQSLVDDYLSSSSTELPPKLSVFAQSYDRSMTLGDRGMVALLAAAKQHRMRVKSVNGRPARTMAGEEMYMRAARMNTYAEPVVRREQAREGAGKYIMELGGAHAVLHPAPKNPPITSHGVQFDQPFPGLAEMLGIPPMGLEEDEQSADRLRLQQRPDHGSP
ncbi:DUF4157 domain-containing protein [Streptomyces sp. NR30]|uniref:DUF4157 domain-containing protein n=2 Tax=Streptomyces guryensis TaxID=2886947 RepID=A0A9Q3Z828_9ACTN|nr:DUF4157 domain-containing protein [Streptomyces guryensis]MCD9875127.1 DUF4157 domain-containing protein [Streptomyces guryensis]